MLEALFKLRENNSNVRRESIAGITTFITMVYIVFVNPAMLAEAGMDQGAAFVATCIAAAIGCFISTCAGHGFKRIFYLRCCTGHGL